MPVSTQGSVNACNFTVEAASVLRVTIYGKRSENALGVNTAIGTHTKRGPTCDKSTVFTRM